LQTRNLSAILPLSQLLELVRMYTNVKKQSALAHTKDMSNSNETEKWPEKLELLFWAVAAEVLADQVGELIGYWLDHGFQCLST
jgi:hypothetical protein